MVQEYLARLAQGASYLKCSLPMCADLLWLNHNLDTPPVKSDVQGYHENLAKLQLKTREYLK